MKKLLLVTLTILYLNANAQEYSVQDHLVKNIYDDSLKRFGDSCKIRGHVFPSYTLPIKDSTEHIVDERDTTFLVKKQVIFIYSCMRCLMDSIIYRRTEKPIWIRKKVIKTLTNNSNNMNTQNNQTQNEPSWQTSNNFQELSPAEREFRHKYGETMVKFYEEICANPELREVCNQFLRRHKLETLGLPIEKGVTRLFDNKGREVFFQDDSLQIIITAYLENGAVLTTWLNGEGFIYKQELK